MESEPTLKHMLCLWECMKKKNKLWNRGMPPNFQMAIKAISHTVTFSIQLSWAFYLADHLSFKTSTHPTYTSHIGRFQITTLKEAQKPVTRNQTFSMVPTSLQNSLPPEMHLAPSFLGFWRQWMTWLFSQAFQHFAPN